VLVTDLQQDGRGNPAVLRSVPGGVHSGRCKSMTYLFNKDRSCAARPNVASVS